jgi:hypothetical protein
MDNLDGAARATDFLRVDHAWLQRLCNEYRAAMRAGMPRATLAAEICRNVEAHYEAEARALFPAVRGHADAIVDRLMQERGAVLACVDEVRAYAYDPPTRDILILRLMDLVERHAAEEERELFPVLDANVPQLVRHLHREVVRSRHAAHLGVGQAA